MLSYGIYLLFQSDSSSFKRKIAAQTDEKSHGKTKRSEKSKQSEENTATMACAVHHGQTVVDSSRPRSFAFRTSHFVLCLELRVLPWIIRLGPNGLLFCSSHDFVWPNLHAFLLTHDLIYVNLQSKT